MRTIAKGQLRSKLDRQLFCFQILSHIFARCASQKTYGHVIIACKSKNLLPCENSVLFSHGPKFFWLVQRAKKCDTNHIPLTTAYRASSSLVHQGSTAHSKSSSLLCLLVSVQHGILHSLYWLLFSSCCSAFGPGTVVQTCTLLGLTYVKGLWLMETFNMLVDYAACLNACHPVIWNAISDASLPWPHAGIHLNSDCTL